MLFPVGLQLQLCLPSGVDALIRSHLVVGVLRRTSTGSSNEVIIDDIVREISCRVSRSVRRLIILYFMLAETTSKELELER